VDAIDEHRQRFSRLWMERGEGGRTQSVHVLLSRRELDDSILHARVLPLVIELVGEDIVCEEHSVMIRAPIDEDPPQPKWHRDTRHEPSHALGIHSLSVVYYLTDVDETTHCFSVVPEAAMTKRGAGSRVTVLTVGICWDQRGRRSSSMPVHAMRDACGRRHNQDAPSTSTMVTQHNRH
jgi:hypothetical protein